MADFVISPKTNKTLFKKGVQKTPWKLTEFSQIKAEWI